MEISSMAADEEYDEYMTNSEFLDRHDSESVDIFDELVDFKKTLSMRMIISLICGAVLTYMNLAVSAGAPVPGFMQPYSWRSWSSSRPSSRASGASETFLHRTALSASAAYCACCSLLS